MGVTIRLENLVKSFTEPQGGQRRVISGLNASLPAGQTVLVDGPSGAGKSTLMNLISGLMLPDEGRVLVGEVEVSALSESARDAFRAARVGYVFQTFNLISALTVRENLTMPPLLSAGNRRVSVKEATDILESFGLGGHLDKRPYQLSVGQRQRVAVARALSQRPALLLADEPTASLDNDSARAVLEAVISLKRQGATLVMATHDPLVKETLAFDQTWDLGRKEVV